MEKICFFIGHRDAPESVLPRLKAAAERHVREMNVTTFVVGHYGRFDTMAAQAVREIKAAHPSVMLLLLPYHPAQRPAEIPPGFDGTYYPFETAVHPRTAIIRANRAMVEQSDCLIAYVLHPGNARAVYEYALRRSARAGLRVENLA